jgi:(2R)-sulfolactate sulfo-lyase subunit alpha
MDQQKDIAIQAKDDIPIGHKVAITDLSENDTVIKYATDIGRVVAPISAGEHVHVHNVKTKRW